jgi:uncharacterized membrane protein SpoIIM required for sporulation
MLLPPPRPDFLPAGVSRTVGRYVRRPPWRMLALLFVLLLAGVVAGLATTLGLSHPQAVSDAQLFRANLPASFTILGIFTHNVLIVLVPVMLFPVLFWGPSASAAVTGFFVGRLAGLWQALHLPTGALVLALAPHGVIEIPSFLVAGVLAWRIGIASWDTGRFGGSWWARVRAAFVAAAPALAAVVAALALAATIEVKVTPALVRAIYG